MGWLTDQIRQLGKLDPIGNKIVTTAFKTESKGVKAFADLVGWRSLSAQAQNNINDPQRGIGRAATATVAAYGAWLGAGAYGAAGAGGAGAGGAGAGAGAGAAGGMTAGTALQYGSAALTAAQFIAARNAARDVPGSAAVTYMPNPNDPQALLARRRKAAEMRNRSGRASTILTDGDTLG